MAFLVSGNTLHYSPWLYDNGIWYCRILYFSTSMKSLKLLNSGWEDTDKSEKWFFQNSKNKVWVRKLYYVGKVSIMTLSAGSHYAIFPHGKIIPFIEHRVKLRDKNSYHAIKKCMWHVAVKSKSVWFLYIVRFCTCSLCVKSGLPTKSGCT